ncbi:GNAT family N-acetyltransferase [Arthrobacter sp. zg-Y411]|uniref:GNAT family N-acetyltransferase n=1 Tax=Arthrobacter zhangbolii TaxID=2886936 RepID=UPI001D14A26C|nr:GNAT family N-acetyltransferase [Arthrobacter zhangbolii]
MNRVPRAELIATERLRLEPLSVHHAREMVPVLAGTAIYRHIGGTAPTAQELAARYAGQSVGASPDGREAWLNWIIREQGAAVGFVQATVAVGAPCPTAYVAWVVGEDFQGRGIATEAARALLSWLLPRTGGPVAAYIAPGNLASTGVARKLGLAGSGQLDEDGEELWRSATPAG